METEIKEKIIDSKKFYQQLRSNQMFVEYRKLLDDLIEDKHAHEIDNDNYAHALLLTGAMFRHTTKSCCMLTGPEGNEFLEELDEDFEGALKRLKRNRGTFRLVLLEPEITKFIYEKMEQHPDILQVEEASLSEGTLIEHFIACDSRMVRHEKPHGRLAPDTPADQVHAKVYFNNTAKAKVTEDRFDALWGYLRGEED